MQLVFALVKAFEIIGEAAFQITPETRTQTPKLPWHDIIGMRHRLVHAYFDIDLDILWKTTQEDLAILIPELERIISIEEDMKRR